MTEMQALVNGYRGSKVHAVDLGAPRNAHASSEGMSLCGWRVMVSDIPFQPNGLHCKTCASSSAA